MNKHGLNHDATVPAYFDALYHELIAAGKTEEQLEELPLLPRELHGIKCTQDTAYILCVKNEFLSIEDLLSLRFTFQDYRTFGLSVEQARLLLSGLDHIKQQRTRRFARIKEITERREQVKKNSERIREQESTDEFSRVEDEEAYS